MKIFLLSFIKIVSFIIILSTNYTIHAQPYTVKIRIGEIQNPESQ